MWCGSDPYCFIFISFYIRYPISMHCTPTTVLLLARQYSIMHWMSY